MGNVVLCFKKVFGQFLLRSDLDCTIDNGIRYQVPLRRPVEIDLPPGPHTVQMAFQYMGKWCGTAGTQFFVQPGMKYQIIYRSPLVVTDSGNISVSVVGAMPPR